MQTFLPFEDFTDSARVLDRSRLGKQRVENLQLMQALTEIRHVVVNGQATGELEPHTPKGWANHPAALMWRGHLDWLLQYQYDIVRTWTECTNTQGKPYRDTCLAKTERVFLRAVQLGKHEEITKKPTWLGDTDFHISHRANLRRKDHAFYAPQFPGVDPTLPYIWPRCECPVH